MMGDLPAPLMKRTFRVDRDGIAYLRFTLESYQGMALVTTLDPAEGLIQVLMPPKCEADILEILDALRDEGLRIEDAKTP